MWWTKPNNKLEYTELYRICKHKTWFHRFKNSIPFGADDGQQGQKRIEGTNNGKSTITKEGTTYCSTYTRDIPENFEGTLHTGSTITGNTVSIASGLPVSPLGNSPSISSQTTNKHAQTRI